MYRAILPNGKLDCDDYEQTDVGITLRDADGEMLAFVPYENLEALMTERALDADEPSVM